MKIKPGYILKKVMGSYMIVSLNDNVNAMQTMNESAAFLWGILEKGATFEELCAKMVSEYEVDSSTARKDIQSFISLLKSRDLLDE